jgi:hypothetical protein
MKRLSTLITVGLTLAAMAVSVSPTMAQPVTSLDPASLVPSFGQPQSADDKTETDHLPAHITARLNLSSIHLLGRDSGGIYSVALDTTGQQICLIAHMTSKIGSINSACLLKTDFAQTPISLGVGENPGQSSPSFSTTAIYLFPADVDLSQLNVATVNHGAGAHAIVQHGSDSLPQQADLNRSDSSGKFTFNKQRLINK